MAIKKKCHLRKKHSFDTEYTRDNQKHKKLLDTWPITAVKYEDLE